MLRPILVADDDEDDVAFLIRILAKSRIENPITSVANGKAVIEYLSGEGIYSDRERFPLPALICLDARMPEYDGFYALDWISRNNRFKDIPVLLLTGSMAVPDASTAYRLGAVSVLTKPCTAEQIKALPPAALQLLHFSSPSP